MASSLLSFQSANIMDNTSGYLEIITGPMYSGKTSKLLDLYKQFVFCGIETLVINYAEDSRYSTTHLVSHNNLQIPCTLITNLFETFPIVPALSLTPDQGQMIDRFLQAKVILINEGQFFKDIVDWVTQAVEVYKKTVFVCGLDSDFKRQKFGNWLDLLLICDTHYKLHAFCSRCKHKQAIFSHRLSPETAQKVIGSDSYIPLCRGCYEIKNKE